MATPSPVPSADRGFRSTDPELAAIDASVRGPVLLCLLSAVHWMVVGTVLLVYASSLRHPQDSIPILGLFVDLSSHCAFFTFGRVWPAALDALVYGWASLAGLGLSAWLLARMSRTPAMHTGVLVVGALFWNLGVAVGLSGIFLGDGSSVELLEFPTCAAAILWVSFLLFGVWGVANFLGRKPGQNHIAQQWLIVALFAFPWLYACGSILLSGRPLPGSGVMQELLSAWYVHGLFTLWLAPLGLALLYYLIPKMSGLSLQYGRFTQAAFWTWIVFAPWTAVHDMVGGPFPADTVSVGLILSGLICVPVAFLGLNLIGTALAGEAKQGEHGGIVFPFLTLAAGVFVLAGITEWLLSVRSINEMLRFTMFRECNIFLWVYGFFSFTAFGAYYYVVPRLLDFGWRSAFLIKTHYYASVYGILLVLAMLGFGGIMQGASLENSDPAVTIVVANGVANSFYIAATVCLSLISIGNGIFALHLGWMLLEWLRQRVRTSRLASEILLEPYEPDPAPASREVSA